MTAPRSALLGLLAVVACGLALITRHRPPPPPPPDGPRPPAAVEADVTAYHALPPGVARQLGSLDLRHPGAASLHFPADGTTLVTAGSPGLRVWDLATHKLLRQYPSESFTGWPSVSTPDNRFFVAMGDKDVRVISREDGKLVRRLAADGSLTCFAVSPDGRTVASGACSGEVRLWELETGRKLPFRAVHPPPPPRLRPAGEMPQKAEPPHPPAVRHVAFSPNGAVVASGAMGEAIRGWDVRTGAEVWQVGHGRTGGGLFALSPDGATVAFHAHGPGPKRWPVTAGVVLWRVAERTPAAELVAGGPNEPVGGYGLAFSPDGRHLASGDHDGVVRLWDAASGKLRHTVPVTPPVGTVAFSRDGRRLAAADGSGVELWDAVSGADLLADGGHTGGIAPALTADGRTAFTTGTEGTVRAWDTATGGSRWVTPPEPRGAQPVDLALSPNGTALAVWTGGTVRVLDAATGREAWRTPEAVGAVFGAAYTPDGKTLAALGPGLKARRWDAATGRELGTLFESDGYAPDNVLRYTPDGTGLVGGVWRLDPDRVPPVKPDPAFGPADRKFQLFLWDATTGRPLQPLGRPDGREHHDLTFLPGGDRFVVLHGAEDEMSVIDLRTGAEERRFPVTGGGLAVAPDGRVWVGGGCYDPATGAKVGGVEAGRWSRPKISADGRLLVTTDSSTALVWALLPSRDRPAPHRWSHF